MKISLWLWIAALLVTLFVARHQRVTGPTYPISGTARLGGTAFAYVLERTHAGAGGHRVIVRPGAADAEGVLEWRVVGDATGRQWAEPMARQGETLVAELPHQPVTGKLAYRVTITRGADRVVLPPQGEAVIRFRNDVPAWVLIPHILTMFGAMLVSTRGGLELFHPKPRFRLYADTTVLLLIAGGIVLGCLVSGYAFGQPWGGFPLGDDPTDNKTLVALIGWIAAAIAARRTANPRGWIALAAIVLIAVYVIPHSVSMPK